MNEYFIIVQYIINVQIWNCDPESTPDMKLLSKHVLAVSQRDLFLLDCLAVLLLMYFVFISLKVLLTRSRQWDSFWFCIKSL